ncbi:uncharacterized protein TRAVEDRAFT_17659 [Trametes versicolor FP-101664 SS1]|uniref:uncharacterized protein n=1 Tax=Trametes versicolor (strain FP-101664) TaxID=717944 RepID=UPI0004622C72|nr:uncharacterized protein TRAVEDRAFT_17659 [Trametes versicolor FP-101664 SS1]EIW63233.1 hypothetical protein TRAVEDRAFT_17659 [Trametes versicolor FP-101664 SS1]
MDNYGDHEIKAAVNHTRHTTGTALRAVVIISQPVVMDVKTVQGMVEDIEKLALTVEETARVRAFRVRVETDQQMVQRLVHTAFKALVYEVGRTRPRLLLLPSRHDWDPACGCPAYPEDLDTDDWFDNDQIVSSVDRFPGTRYRLANGYDIISARGQRRAAKTATLNGTLVVVKRASRHSGRAVNITPPEVSLINAVVERYVAG